MNKLYKLKYKNISDLLLSDINKKDDSGEFLVSKNLVKDFANANFDIKLDDNIYISSSNDRILVYRMNGAIKILMIDFSNPEDICVSEIAKRDLSDEDRLYSLASEVILAIKFTFDLINIYDSKKIKIIKGKFYDKIKIKNSKVEVLVYSETSNSNYSILKLENRVEFMDNKPNKTVITIPSKLYPLPNDNPIKIFSSENTEDIQDNKINELLTDVEFRPGYCYTNSDKVIKILKDNNFKNKIEFFSGWLYSIGNMVHHAWVVIDDKHLIDTSIMIEDEYYEKMIEKYEKGENFKLSRNEIAKEVVKVIKSSVSFKEKYGYGKVLKDNLYIGVKTNSMEARKSFNDLINREPNHPNYKNVDSNGGNKTLDLIYDKM